MGDSIYPKEVEELKALRDDTQETCELIRLIAAGVAARRIKNNEGEMADLIQFLPVGLDPTGT